MFAGVSVGIGFSIDFWFIHIRISLQIGAELWLWGPPVAGRVHVDFWIVSFDVRSGDSDITDGKVSLSEFYEHILEDGSDLLEDWQFERYIQKLPSSLWARCKFFT